MFGCCVPGCSAIADSLDHSSYYRLHLTMWSALVGLSYCSSMTMCVCGVCGGGGCGWVGVHVGCGCGCECAQACVRVCLFKKAHNGLRG